ncbi:MAG: peptidase M20, partial [Acidimicrobiales bacterium]
MPLLSFDDLERDVLPTLTRYCEIPSLSPMFDADWATTGYLNDAAELIAQWARERALANAEVQIHRLEGRTTVVTVTLPATNAATGTCVLYGHLDKQPPLGDWSEGLGP